MLCQIQKGTLNTTKTSKYDVPSSARHMFSWSKLRWGSDLKPSVIFRKETKCRHHHRLAGFHTVPFSDTYLHVRWDGRRPARPPWLSGWGRSPSFGSSGSHTAECGNLKCQSPAAKRDDLDEWWENGLIPFLYVYMQSTSLEMRLFRWGSDWKTHTICFRKKTKVVIITTVIQALRFLRTDVRDVPDHTGAWCCRCPVPTPLFPWRSRQQV